MKSWNEYLELTEAEMNLNCPELKVGDILVRTEEGTGTNEYCDFFQITKRTATRMEVRQVEKFNGKPVREKFIDNPFSMSIPKKSNSKIKFMTFVRKPAPFGGYWESYKRGTNHSNSNNDSYRN